MNAPATSSDALRALFEAVDESAFAHTRCLKLGAASLGKRAALDEMLSFLVRGLSVDIAPAALFYDVQRDEALLGFGLAESLTLDRALDDKSRADHLGPAGQAFFSVPFDPGASRSEAWAAYASLAAFVPRLTLRLAGGVLTWSAHRGAEEAPGAASDDARELLERLSAAHAVEEGVAALRLTEAESRPDAAAYMRGVEQASRAFDAGALDKVVLARRLSVTVPEADALAHLSHALGRLSAAEQGYLFVLSPRPDTVFFGLTPELLFHRRGEALHTEALAGTRPRGATANEDAALGEELLHNDKERREHAAVVDHVVRVLEESGAKVTAAKRPELRKLARIQHLLTPITAQLPDDDTRPDDATLLMNLHPTPAVGGVPRDKARAFIAEAEGFDRGLYTGALGVAGPDGTTAAVALRCGLLEGDALHLFAGAGLVAGSIPAQEWKEVEAKTSGLLTSFDGGGDD